MRQLTIILVTALILSVSFLGCAPKTGTYGQAITETETTPIGDILSRASQFAETTVKVNGKIVEECPAGGWFMLKDDTGAVLVNLHPSYFAIPQAVGQKAVAQGVVKKEGTRVEIVGKGVQLK